MKNGFQPRHSLVRRVACGLLLTLQAQGGSLGYSFFICFAIGLSSAGFVSLFAAKPVMSQSGLAQMTVAVSIFLGAVSLAFIDRSFFSGLSLTVGGMVIAIMVDKRLSMAWSLIFATFCFGAYISGVGSLP